MTEFCSKWALKKDCFNFLLSIKTIIEMRNCMDIGFAVCISFDGYWLKLLWGYILNDGLDL
jgi:hypothetical protein